MQLLAASRHAGTREYLHVQLDITAVTGNHARAYEDKQRQRYMFSAFRSGKLDYLLLVTMTTTLANKALPHPHTYCYKTYILDGGYPSVIVMQITIMGK